ncbi:MAG: hypothetical protein RL742_874 [Bacteroidota bacterium]|jgi:hypothetical protein
MNIRNLLLAFLLIGACFARVSAQDDDLLAGLEPDAGPEPVLATFKGTRLINFHTVETPGRRTLDFRIAHRFGPFNSGWYDFFGLDGSASIRIGLEYSYDGRLAFGIGRTSYEKMLDGFVKYKLLRQMEGGGMPVTVTLFSGMYATMQKDPDKQINGFDKYARVSSRLSYVHQVIIGRKFSDRFSLQVAPVYLHYNLVDRISDKNDALVLTAATRFKFTKRAAITFEYGYRAIKNSRTAYYDTMGIGCDIETGGHVFQFFVTNSFGLLENQFLTRTDTRWSDMGIRLGFNISRVFTI